MKKEWSNFSSLDRIALFALAVITAAVLASWHIS